MPPSHDPFKLGPASLKIGDLKEHLAEGGASVPVIRTLSAIAHFWFQTRKQQGSPSREHLRPEELVQVLPDLFIIDTLSRGKMRYRLVGTRLTSSFPSDPTKLMVGAMGNVWGDSIVRQMAELIRETTKPHLFTAYVPTPEDYTPVVIAAAFPLFDEDGNVNMVLGAGALASDAVMGDTRPERLAKVELLP